MFDEFLLNELQMNRESGTYLFYGDNENKMLKIAILFAKSLCCSSDEIPFCDECNSCLKINELVYSDLNIIDSLKMDEVKKMEQISYASAHDGKNKIFIIRNFQDVNKESSNAILKLIEEPTENNFFILLTTKLSILPTIKSRSILVKINRSSAKELNISNDEFDFFYGNERDIAEFKEKGLDLSSFDSYQNIYKNMKEYEDSPIIENKIKIYKSINDFIAKRNRINDIEKIFFAEELFRSISERPELEKIISYIIFQVRKNKDISKKLEMKKMLRYPINMKLFLVDFCIAL